MIRVRDIKKDYYLGDTAIPVLSGISFDIPRGSFTAIVGASGSGKSTLMNILGCLDRMTSGTYLMDGEDVAGYSAKQFAYVRGVKIGFIFQGFNLINGMSAIENVALPLVYRGVAKKQRDFLAMSALEMVGLSDRINHKPSELSGGQQQRVAIARAIAAKPPIILADEPCGNLDSRAGAAVMGILREMNAAGRTIILITHDETAAGTADRILRISDGTMNN